MTNQKQKNNSAIIGRFVAVLFDWPVFEIAAQVWKFGRRLWHGFTDEGIYEVLEHEATLEILDKAGKKARVCKRQKVRYLQDDIIAYQDQAWGDGEILVNYQCKPGVEADRYELDHKTHILISLRMVKHKGDTDEFNITWEQRNGYLRQIDQWGSEVSHRTKKLKVQVIFPKTRIPNRVSIVEYHRQKSYPISQSDFNKLSDGRMSVSWETNKPRLYEQYSLQWEW